MMLDYFGMPDEAATVRKGVDWTLQNKFVTKDIDSINFYFTSTIGDLVADYISNKFTGEVNQSNIELRKSTII